MPVGRIANCQRPRDRLRTLRFDLGTALLDRRRDPRAPWSLRAKELSRLRIDKSQKNQLIKPLLDLSDQRPPRHRYHDVIGQAPAQLLSDFITHRLRAFSVIGTKVDVHKSPAMFIGDLRTQTIDMIVAAIDAHQLRTKHLRAENLRG